jgi:glycosyltransferase involved in cell wall biosynthesis
MSSKSIACVVVINHPAQQFTTAFRLLSSQPGVRLKVFYWSVADRMYDKEFDRSVSWDVDLLGGYAWAAPPASMSASARIRWLTAQFRSARPEMVVCYGWASPIARVSISYCLLTRTKLLLYGDSTWQHSSNGRHPVLRSMALRLLMCLCTGAVSTGTFNREFYIRYGMHPRRIWSGVCPADTDTFGEARANHIIEAGALDRTVRIGFAGKLIPRKGVDELLHAVALLAHVSDYSVTLVGDGPQMAELRMLAAHLGVGDRVTFHGFANTTEMPKLLAGFDVVVVPSRLDMRALVTIEAMAAGAAVVVSDATAVWGPGDLVEHDVTGLVYLSGDSRALASELSRLIGDRSLLMRLRSAGMERAAAYGPAAFARTMASAVQRCVSSSADTRRQGRRRATTGP